MGLSYTFDRKKDVLIVRLNGELDHHESEALRSDWKDKMYQSPVKHVVLNFENVSFMDSSGLGVILGRYKDVLQLGGVMVVCSISASIKRVFDFSCPFKIVRSEERQNYAHQSLSVAA